MLPSADFVARFNIARADAGQPMLTSLDPLMMLAWDLANSPPPVQQICLITGV